jgi:leukotriene-A4 hydrolase
MPIHDSTSFADLSQGRIRHIDFHIQTDFSTNILAIKATYHLEAPRRGPLFLDTFKIDLQKAHANGRALTWEFDTHNESLGSRLHLKGLDGDLSFTLEFRTSPEASALQWLNAAQTLGGEHPFLYSQCQNIHARSVFPCQDTPSVRFTFSAEVNVPKGLTAVMAAEQVESQKGSGHFVFRMPQPIPSYLFALAAGNLEFREFGPRTGIYAEPQIIESAAWEFAENETKIAEAEKLLGPYLWGRYDLLVLPPSFPFGGMENPRLTFLTPTSILGTRGQTYLITHELAHAWTGNLVTNATWQDFWLNEGWTTYAETRITEVLEGRDFNDLNSVFHVREMQEAMDRLGMDSPQTCLKQTNSTEADSGAFSIPYYKGCFFLQECEHAVGRIRFDAFIQSYMKRFQFQSITTEMFLDFLKAELPEVFAKVDVHKWIYEPGMPEGWQRPQSHLYDEVQATLNAYQQGTLPTRAQVENWHSDQVKSFLQGLPPKMPAADCPRIEEVLDLKKWNDAAHFSFFYSICITSGYESILPRVEIYAEQIGRMLYILPVFRALIQTDWSRGVARPLFERIKSHHHQITVNGMERMLARAGL